MLAMFFDGIMILWALLTWPLALYNMKYMYMWSLTTWVIVAAPVAYWAGRVYL